jgi:hypothetical protein
LNISSGVSAKKPGHDRHYTGRADDGHHRVLLGGADLALAGPCGQVTAHDLGGRERVATWERFDLRNEHIMSLAK